MSAVLTAVEDDFPRDRQVAQLRIPPHSIEAESSVLGGLLLDNQAWDRVGDLLVDGDFYRYEHKLIFGSVGALINASKPADVITVFEHLQAQGKAEEVGGLSYLNSLAQYVPSAANIRRYAEIVRERSILRKLVSASDEIATAAFNTQGKPVGTPVMSFGLSAISWTRSSSCTTRLSMPWKPCFIREPSSPMLKIFCSASSRIFSTGLPWVLKAAVAISSLAETSLRRMERSRTISA